MRRLLILILLTAGAASANTYYIDYSSGSDTNVGSKASPWKSHPYMNCSTHPASGSGSYAHVAGDQFIFKGGVTWPVACFQMSIPAGGTPSATDYYGIDVTWFTGVSFADPKFDLAHNIPTGNHVIVATSTFPGYATFDHLEIANQGLHVTTLGNGDAYDFLAVTGSNPGVLIEYGDIHDWSTPDDFSVQTGGNQHYAAGGIMDGHDHITVDHTILDDTGGWFFVGTTQHFAGFGGACENCRVVSNGTFINGWGTCFTVVSCHDNEMTGVTQATGNCVGSSTCSANAKSVHTQVVEDDLGSIDGMLVYNNYIHDNPGAGVTIYVNYSSRIFNNALRNNSNKNINIGHPGSGYTSLTNAGFVVNNTVDCSNGQACFGTDSKGTISGPLTLNNNIFITNGTPISLTSSITSFTNGPNNYPMSTTEAANFGFTTANKFKPVSSDSNVAGKGANYSSISTLDASGSAWYGSAYVNRPTNPDLGAFQGISGGGGTAFISLSASSINFGGITVGQASAVQTVTLTNTGTATASFTSSSITGQFAFGGTGTCVDPGGTLAPNATCTFSARFMPTSAGAQSGVITINDTATNSPQTISLTGTGVAALVTFAPSSNNYGPVNQGSSSSPATFTLTNTSGASMTIISVSDAGGNPADFPITNTLCTGVIAAGNGCSFTAAFTPQAAGARSTTLTVSYSGGDNVGSTTSALSGTGVQVTVTTPSIFPPFGSFSQLTVVTLSDSTAGAAICYTLDGTPPQTNGAGSCVLPTLTYSGPIQLVNTTVVQAVGTKASLTDSATASATIIVIIPAGAPAMMTRLSPQLQSRGMMTQLRR